MMPLMSLSPASSLAHLAGVTHLRLTPDTPDALSRELRTSAEGYLPHRRVVVALALAACGAMGAIGLYQMGIIRHLPEPPLPLFDADRIDASPQAYSHLSTPDALLGLGSYAATAVLAAMGGADRARAAPWLPLALAAKLGFDVGQGVRLTIQQWTGYRQFCFWCLLAAAASFVAAPFTLSEARAAVRALRHRAW